MNDRWIDRLNQLGVFAVAQRLGFETDEKKRCVYACPACHAERRHTKRDDKRGALSVKNDELWHCWQCEAGGDAVDLLAFHIAGAKFSACTPEQKAAVRAAALREVPSYASTSRPSARAQRPAPSSPAAAPAQQAASSSSHDREPRYPPGAELDFVWTTSTPLAESEPALSWLREQRQLDAVAVANAMDLRYLAAPLDERAASWAGFRRRADDVFVGWHAAKYRVLFPMYDAAGVMRSLTARRIPDAKRGPKSFPPVGYERAGLVIADRRGQELLAGTLHLPDATRLVIVIAEGELDVAAWSAAPVLEPDVVRAVLGIQSGSWTAAVAARIPDGATVLIATDLDNEGEKYAALVGRALAGRVELLRWPLERDGVPKDANDWVRRGLPLALAGVPYEPPAQEDLRSDDPRPLVELDSNQERAVDAAIRALEHEPRIFRRSATLMRIVAPGALPEDLTHRDEDFSSIVPLQSSTLAEYLSTCARVVDVDKSFKPCRPPQWLLNSLLERQTWPALRHLEAMVATPVLLPSGEILAEPGYDARSGLFLAGTGVDVPRSPTGADVRGALELLADLVKDFPFAKLAHRSAWLACVLTMLSRFAFRGASPFFVFDGSTAGSGKTILAGAAVVVGTGQTIPTDSIPINRGAIDDRELRKEILSWAISARRVICFDNFAGAVLASGELERAVTSMHVAGRVLGGSVDWSGPLCATWILTGNNVEIGGDMQRRVLHVRLEPHVERPEERTFARAFDPYVSKRRLDLTRAALILLRAYCEAGRPDQHLPSWGSFDAWSDVVRGAIVWAGWPDPNDTREELRRASATREEVERALLIGWAQLVETSGRRSGWTTKEALAAIYPQSNAMGFEEPTGMPNMQAAIAELLGEPDSRELGKLLKRLRGRVVRDAKGPLSVDIKGTAQGGVVRWGVVRYETGHVADVKSIEKSGGTGAEQSGLDGFGWDRSLTTRDARAHARAGTTEQFDDLGGVASNPPNPAQPTPADDGESGRFDQDEDDDEPPLGRDGP